MNVAQPVPVNAPAVIALPAHPAYIQAVLDFAETLSEGLGFVQRERQHIRLAVEEIIAFIGHTAFAGLNLSPLSMTFEPRADGLAIRLVAQGLPLDVEHMPEYNPADAARPFAPDGLSLFLAKKVMDQVVFTNRGRGGLEVELLKRRAAAHVQAMLPSEPPPRPGPEPEAVHFTIRPPRDEEALEISRCAFLTYGYTYEDYIYYPDRILQLNRSGELHSRVAVNERGEVLGHCALKFDSGRRDRAELGVLFVRPEFRKFGIGKALWQAIVQLGREMRLESIFARSVTGHRVSQMLAHQSGFSDCALYLSLFPPAVELKSLGGRQPGKMSGMLQVLDFQPAATRAIEPPERHAEMVRELYHRAGIPTRICTPAERVRANESPLLRTLRLPIFNVGRLEIENPGPNLNEAMHWIDVNLRRLCGEKMDALYLYVNLMQPGAALMAEHAEQVGSIFSGIAPGYYAGGDAIVLQYLNLAADPFANLTVWTDTAALLRDYIRQEWERRNKI